VFVTVNDPVGSGFVESLTRPRGNITGFTTFRVLIRQQMVGLLKELPPNVKRVALLYNPTTALTSVNTCV